MMIRVARIGTRNRVVLPPEVMDILGVEAGDAVFFLVQGRTVRLSRGPETFGEYLQLHGEPLAAPDDADDIDPRQMRFGWPEAALEP
jgi:antitoxin component of MazEF toxin-antitoxin module